MKKGRKHYSGKELLEMRKKERERKIMEEKERKIKANLNEEFRSPTIQVTGGYSMKLINNMTQFKR